MRRRLPDFEQAGSRVVLVGMGTPEETADFIKNQEIVVPMVSDPNRRLYRSFGLKMATIPELFRPSVAFKAVAALAQGHTVGLPAGDIRQLPGVFIIDTGGRIVFSHEGRDAGDHPDPETLLAALRPLTEKKVGE